MSDAPRSERFCGRCTVGLKAQIDSVSQSCINANTTIVFLPMDIVLLGYYSINRDFLIADSRSVGQMRVRTNHQ